MPFWKRFYPRLHFLGFVVTDLLEQSHAFGGIFTSFLHVLLMQGNVGHTKVCVCQQLRVVMFPCLDAERTLKMRAGVLEMPVEQFDLPQPANTFISICEVESRSASARLS